MLCSLAGTKKMNKTLKRLKRSAVQLFNILLICNYEHSIQFTDTDFDFRFIQKSPSVDLDHIFPTWHERCFDPKLSQSINKWVTCCVWWRSRKSFNVTPVCWCLLTKKFRYTSPKDIQLRQRKILIFSRPVLFFLPTPAERNSLFHSKKKSVPIFHFKFNIMFKRLKFIIGRSVFTYK